MSEFSYPTRHGIPIAPYELALPPSHTRIENNHHNAWTKKRMGRFIVTQTLRDLDAMQFQLPKDQHVWLHDTYDPPEIALSDAYIRVHEAFESNEYIRLGTCYHGSKSRITPELIMQIESEKERLNYE